MREAWSDLCVARLLFRSGRWNASAFYSHQAAEKALKALWLVELRREPPKSHVLTELYRELKRSGLELSPLLEEKIAELNKFYTVSRYPDAAGGQPYEAVTKSDAERSLRTAEDLLDLAELLLKAAGYEGTPTDLTNC
ncbi:MAG: HEPN domain-containing protein [Thermoproteus sp.]